MIGHFRREGAEINEGLNRLREQLIREHQNKDHLVFADFILGKGDEQFGVLGFTFWKVFVYCGSGILYEQDTPGLGYGSGGMWDEALNKELVGKQFKSGSLDRTSIIQWVEDNSTPGACAAYYDQWKWESN